MLSSSFNNKLETRKIKCIGFTIEGVYEKTRNRNVRINKEHSLGEPLKFPYLLEAWNPHNLELLKFPYQLEHWCSRSHNSPDWEWFSGGRSVDSTCSRRASRSYGSSDAAWDGTAGGIVCRTRDRDRVAIRCVCSHAGAGSSSAWTPCRRWGNAHRAACWRVGLQYAAVPRVEFFDLLIKGKAY